jgi:ABC-2 type transport system permease protein
MRALSAIYLRELRAYLHSSIAYVLWVVFLLITGYFFFTGVASYSMASLQAMQKPMFMHINLQEWLISPLLGNMSVIMMFITPLLTMRLISEEKRIGTLELLLSYPLTDLSVVLGKYLAALTMLALILAPTLVHLAILVALGDLYWPAVLVGYFGLLLEGGGFLALGLTTSALTENQIVAAVAGFAGLLFLWIVGWSSSVVGPEIGAMLKGLSLSSHFENFSKDLLDTADLVYFVVFIGFFLFLSVRALEAKRWKA